MTSLLYELTGQLKVDYLLFHTYSRQETNTLSPEGLLMSNSVG